jgi:hypothetical protein
MPSLIGNKPNQVSTNGDLGTLAFQDSSNVKAGSITADTLTVDTTTLVVDATNNRVGVGTNSPSSTIHVAGGTDASTSYDVAILAAGSSNTLGSGSKLYLSGTPTSPTIRAAMIEGVVTGATNAHSMLFYTSASGASPTERMRITSTGNVGIGTSSPLGRLNVVSTIRVSDSSTETNALLTTVSGSSATIETRYGTPLIFGTNAIEAMRITSAGNVGIGTSSPSYRLDVSHSSFDVARFVTTASNTDARINIEGLGTGLGALNSVRNGLVFQVAGTERMRLDSSGNLLVGTTSNPNFMRGAFVSAENGLYASTSSAGGFVPLQIVRTASDGDLVSFIQAGTQEGSISVSGTTVSYNGGHLARWSQLLDGSKDESILKGTVLSNLDEMCVWEKDGVVAENEQLNKMKVSDVEGDINVAGVFVNWTMDEQYGVDDMNIAMTGDMIIRIAEGVTVQRGDLLMSAGDGTAKPQGDDIVRSKTIAKVTSTNITCTYADGSYCVPCVLMAC